MFGRVIYTMLLGHYSVEIGYQREDNCTEKVLKHVFLNNTFPFCAIALLDKSCSIKFHAKKEKSCNIKFLQPT